MVLFGSEKRILGLTNKKQNNGPAPGSYSTLIKGSNSRNKNQPSFSMGTAARSGPVKAFRAVPGPGSYDTYTKYVIGSMNKSGGISLGLKLENQSHMSNVLSPNKRSSSCAPGPGAYNGYVSKKKEGGYMGKKFQTGGYLYN